VPDSLFNQIAVEGEDGGTPPSSFFVERKTGGAFHSLYTKDMQKRTAIVQLWIALFFLAIPCYAQSSPARQQQFQAHKRKAQEHLNANRPELAIPEFETMVTLDPKDVDARGNPGVLLFFQDAFLDAIPNLRAALKLEPSLWKIEALLGIAEKRTGDLKGARNDFEKSFPRLTEKKIRIDTDMELIELYSNTGDLDKAAAIVSVLRELDPTNVEIIYAAYRIYSDLTDESRLSLSVAGPKSARMHQMMAHELARQGKADEAIENYREALEIDPKLQGVHFELAEMLNNSSTVGGPEEAEREYKAALEVNPFDEKSEFRLGEIAASRGDLKEASNRYSRALQLKPDDPEANLGLAKVLMSMNQSEKAERLLKRAIQLDPTIAVVHFRLSTIYRQTGRANDAKRELDEYQKYKDMKEKLRDIYRAMRLEPSKQEHDDTDVHN
jgi:tetratricopeptide (TPR) repeat protein